MAKRNVRVLIADDEAHIRLLLKKVFESMNCEVVAQAGNGEDAVREFTEHNPDIVMLDINMPRMDGRQALREIKAASPQTTVIMLTSLSSMDVVEECLGLGADNYLRKDTPLADIKRNIKETYLDRIQQQQKG